MYYHLYDYSIKNKKYDFIFQNSSPRLYGDIIGGRYIREESDALVAEYSARTGLSKAEIIKRVKSMEAINDEVYIFGSLLKREIFDWLKELAHFKKVYHLKMKQINPNYITSSSKEMSNNINIMNNEINDNIFL